MSCITHMKGKSTHFIWKVLRFEMMIGEKIQSPLFSSLLLEGTRFYLEILAKYSLVRDMVVSLHRYIDDGPEIMSVDLQFEFLKNNILQYKKSCDAVVFQKNENFYDTQNTLQVTMDTNLVETIDLTIHCRVSPSQSTLNVRQIFQKVDENLSGDLRSLFLSSLHYDTILSSKDSAFKCHKAILKARIPKILDCVVESSTETVTRITFPYDASKALHSLVLYAYTGSIDLEGQESEFKEFNSIAGLFGDDNLVQRLKWKDCVIAETTANCDSESITWPVKRVLYLNVNLIEKTRNNVKDNKSKEICNIECEILPDENREKYLFLTITFPPVVFSRYALVLGQIQLLRNNNADAITLYSFRHYTQTDEPKIYKKKTMTISYLQTIISEVIFDETFFLLKFNIQVWKGVIGRVVMNSEASPIDLFDCEACRQLSSDLQKLYQTQDCCDVKFISDHKTEFPAHRAIVAARSPMLKMFLDTSKHSDYVRAFGEADESLSQTLLCIYNGLNTSM